MNIPNIARMGKHKLYVKHRDSVPKLRVKLERLEKVLEAEVKRHMSIEEGLRVDLATMQIELDHARLYENKLKGHVDKVIFAAKQFRWIGLALIVIFVAWAVQSVVMSLIGQRQ